jgi:hypothetical protein
MLYSKNQITSPLLDPYTFEPYSITSSGSYLSFVLKVGNVSLLWQGCSFLKEPDAGKLLELKNYIFWSLTRCSLVKFHRRFQSNTLPDKEAECLLLVWLTFFTLEMETIRFSDTSVNFYRTTRRHVWKDSTLRTDRCENLEYLFPIFA